MKAKRVELKHPRPAPRRALWVAGALLVVSLLISTAVWADWYYGLPADAQATFVGRQSCVQCHQPEHEQWTGSHHDLAMDVATEATVLGDFNDAELEHYGVTSRMFRQDGKFFIHTEGPDGKLADFEIKYVFGVDPLQQYMVEFDRPADMPEHEIARVQVLRVSWDTKAKKWFHLDPPDVQEKLEPNDELHWTGVAQRWNNMCADCHSTNLQKNFDVATLGYHTTFSEIDVSCEACHGPGSLHVQLAGASSLFWDRNHGYALAGLKGASSQGEIQACAPCHSRRRVVHDEYTAGCNYYDYFSNNLLPAGTYHADGQILDEVYEHGSFLQSKMYHKGIRCTDCHDPHTARLKHEGNKVCTSCHQHPAGKYDSFNHHRHAAGKGGTQCVDCHMPETTYMAVDPRRDHSFRIPRPDLSVKLGTPNACTGCHLKEGVGGSGLESTMLASLKTKEYAEWLRVAASGDEQVQARLAQVDRWADQQLDQWYGKDRKREPHYAEALHAARTGAADAPEQLARLATNGNMPAIARATAAMELAPYVGSDELINQALAKALKDRDPQVRAAAVGSLQGLDSEALTRLAGEMLDDPARAVRVEAGYLLAPLPPLALSRTEKPALQKAIAEAFVAANVDSDRAGGHRMRGVLYENLQQPEKAEAAYRTALRVEPDAVGSRANLAALLVRRVEQSLAQARQLAQSGNAAAARELLAQAGPLEDEANRLRDGELALLEHDALLVPDNAGLQTRLGFLRSLQGWRKEAEDAFRAAYELEPRVAPYAANLATFLRDTGRPREARALIHEALQEHPGNDWLTQMQQELQQIVPTGPTRRN
ncbi:MAG: ammonia-forming cytochrome c nitrite reductase subunit c552 [Pirellulaceae bacterium]